MRRKRFTVDTDAGKRVILDYSAERAREYYEKRGHIVYTVAQGDYRMLERKQRARAARPFKVDNVALEAAIAELGLRYPVTIRLDSRVGSTLGNHRFSARNPTHRIMLKSYQGAREASHTLWHELTHAVQAERAILQGRTWEEAHAEQRRYSYKQRPIEHEANRMADRKADQLLTREA